MIVKNSKPGYCIVSMFGKTVEIPKKITYKGKEYSGEDWDVSMWIERGEDWYAIRPNKKTLIVERQDFLNAELSNKIDSIFGE